MESICLILIFLFLFIYLFLLQWTGGRELGRDQMGSVGFMGHATAGGRGYCLDHTVTTHNQSLSAKTKFKLPLYGTLMFCNVACRVLQFPLVIAMNLVNRLIENLVSQHEVGVDVHGPSLTLTWCVLDLILEVGV